MVFKSDRQRKGFFGSRGNSRSNTRPTITRSSKPKLPKNISTFISKQISKEFKAGKGQQQSVAIAFSKARKKFGNGRLEITKNIKNSPTNDINKRTRRIIFLLLGTAVALQVLRGIE